MTYWNDWDGQTYSYKYEQELIYYCTKTSKGTDIYDKYIDTFIYKIQGCFLSVITALEVVEVPAVVWTYFPFNSVHLYLTKKSLFVFRTRVFSNYRYIWIFIYLIENTPVVILDPTSSFQLTVSLFFCKYNWIYSYSLWD